MNGSIKLYLITFVTTALVACSSLPSNDISTSTPTPQLSVAFSPVTIKGLRKSTFKAELKYEKALKEDGVMLYSYESDLLKLFAMVNQPQSAMPENGFPVVIFGHGFHPNPPQYGISNSTGEPWRPGDYYRGIPAAYAERGFVTITPDYRGHNVSEGAEFTHTSYLASSYYARDVLSLLAALPSMDGLDLNRIYYIGHSMGVDVGLKTLLATDTIRAASLWSGVIANTPQQVLFYGKSSLPGGTAIDMTQLKEMHSKINDIYAAKAPGKGFPDVDPVAHLNEINTPLLVQHGTGDTGAPYLWSESFVNNMLSLQKNVTLFFYNTDEHLFSGEMRAIAVQRDVNFFNSH